MKNFRLLLIALTFVCVFSTLSVEANIVYYPADNGVEITVKPTQYCIIYSEQYSQVYYTYQNVGSEDAHTGSPYNVAVCDTYDEYYNLVISIDPDYFYPPWNPEF